MIPDLLLVTAGDLRDNELDILGDQLTLLPGDRLTGLCASPHLVNKRRLTGKARFICEGGSLIQFAVCEIYICTMLAAGDGGRHQ